MAIDEYGQIIRRSSRPKTADDENEPQPEKAEKSRGVSLEFDPETGEFVGVADESAYKEKTVKREKRDYILLHSDNNQKPVEKVGLESGEAAYVDENLQKIRELRRRLKSRRDPLAYKQEISALGLEETGLSREDMGKTGDSRTGEVTERHRQAAESQIEDAKYAMREEREARETVRKKFKLDEHLGNLADRYCEGMSEEAKAALLARISSFEGNKKYAVNENRPDGSQYRIAQKGEDGRCIYDLDELKEFPDINSDEFKSKVYAPDSDEHNYTVSRAKELLEKFSGNDSKVSQDLKNLLEHSDIEFRVRHDWKYPNGSCAFKEGKFGEKNKIVICLCDLGKTGDEALPGILAHELGHALDFSQRPAFARTQYMDGSETFADITGTALAVNAGVDPRGFAKFMGQDYDRKAKSGEGMQMLYSPDGNYRRENFNLAFREMNRAKKNREKMTLQDKIDGLRGVSSARETSSETQTKPRENVNNGVNMAVVRQQNGGR